MYIYIYMYIYMYIYVHTYIYTDIRIHKFIHEYIYTYLDIHTHTSTWIRTRTCTCTRTRTRTRTRKTNQIAKMTRRVAELPDFLSILKSNTPPLIWHLEIKLRRPLAEYYSHLEVTKKQTKTNGHVGIKMNWLIAAYYFYLHSAFFLHITRVYILK